MTIRNRAFTLIELLVVIAIIAILEAILFPVFAQAKVSAKKAADLSNIKQNGLGMLMYASDFDDVFPVYFSGQEAVREDFLQSSIWSAAGVLGPYLKNTEILRSPDDNYTLGDFGDYPTTRARPARSSYMPNTVHPSTAWAYPDIADPRGPIGFGSIMESTFNGLGSVSQTAASSPADVILLAPGRADWEQCAGGSNAWTNTEIQWYPYWTTGIGAWGWDIQALTVAPWDANCEKAWRRYNGSANFVFLDGHAKTLKPGELMSGNNPNPKRWLINAP